MPRSRRCARWVACSFLFIIISFQTRPRLHSIDCCIPTTPGARAADENRALGRPAGEVREEFRSRVGTRQARSSREERRRGRVQDSFVRRRCKRDSGVGSRRGLRKGVREERTDESKRDRKRHRGEDRRVSRVRDDAEDSRARVRGGSVSAAPSLGECSACIEGAERE